MMLTTTLVVSFLVCCMLEVMCGWAGVLSVLQAKAQLCGALACSPDKKETTNVVINIIAASSR